MDTKGHECLQPASVARFQRATEP